MKRFALASIFILITSSVWAESLIEPFNFSNKTETVPSPLLIPHDENPKISSKYELFLGYHRIKYFADRMVLKSKRAGYPFANKKQLKDGSFLVILGPFNSESDARTAEDKIKTLVKDLTVNEVRAIK